MKSTSTINPANMDKFFRQSALPKVSISEKWGGNYTSMPVFFNMVCNIPSKDQNSERSTYARNAVTKSLHEAI